MNTKFAKAAALILILTLTPPISTAYTQSCKETKVHGWSTQDKISHQAHFMLINKDELGLSNEQAKKIKELKLKAKKDSIKAEAEIEMIALDIKAKMWEETVDVTAINKLIDQKYEFKKAKAKSLVAVYAELKGILTDEQKEKLKGLWKKCKTEKRKSQLFRQKQ